MARSRAGRRTATADVGFGREARDALARRRQWLIEQDLARQETDRIVYRANMLGLLRGRELARIGAQLSGDLGLSYAEAQPGDRIVGIYRRRLDLASGRLRSSKRVWNSRSFRGDQFSIEMWASRCPDNAW